MTPLVVWRAYGAPRRICHIYTFGETFRPVEQHQQHCSQKIHTPITVRFHSVSGKGTDVFANTAGSPARRSRARTCSCTPQQGPHVLMQLLHQLARGEGSNMHADSGLHAPWTCPWSAWTSILLAVAWRDSPSRPPQYISHICYMHVLIGIVCVFLFTFSVWRTDSQPDVRTHAPPTTPLAT